MSDVDPIARLARDVFERECGPAVVAAAEEGWAPALWDALAATGLDQVGSGEAGGLREAAAVARAAGASAAPVPIVETILARRVLEAAGLDIPEGPVTIAAAENGRATRVPWARIATAVVLVTAGGESDEVVLVPRDACELTPGLDLAREPRDGVAVLTAGTARGSMAAGAFRLEGALLRSLQIAGALETARRLVFEHASVREQFGRPIARFQAVQHSLALLAAEAASADAASAAAVDAAEASGPGAALVAIAAAKIRAGMAASEGARLAHQVHGAIGVTHEHRLHHFTTRLWTWRDEFGAEREWALRLGRAVAGTGDAYWERLTV